MSHRYQTRRDADTDAEVPPRSEPLVETTPSIRPPLVDAVGTLLLGGLAIGYLFANPNSLGSPGITEIGVNLVMLLVVLGVIRSTIKMYMLTRTTYTVTTDAVHREYSLLYRTFSRELPLSMVRSHELDQSRVETLFGIGSVGFLTGSTVRTPAYIEFEHIAAPDKVRERVREQLAAANYRRQSPDFSRPETETEVQQARAK